MSRNRRRRRRREPAKRVEHPAELGDQRDEQQIGKSDPRELDDEVELRRIGGETRREEIHRPGHRDLHRGAENEQHDGKHGERPFAEPARRVGAVFGQDAGEERDEGGREGPLGEQPAEEVRQLESDEERVRHRTRAEQGGDQNIADETEDAARHRVSADGGDGAQESHAVSRRAAHCAQVQGPAGAAASCPVAPAVSPATAAMDDSASISALRILSSFASCSIFSPNRSLT